jgi:hypothetical protein
MKKSISIVIALIVVGLVAWFFTRGNQSADISGAGSTAQVNSPTSLTQVSSTLSMYRNEELGFSVQYPTAWTVEASPSGALFTIPHDATTTGMNTLNKLQVNVDVVPGSCTFPQVTTIDAHDSIKVNDVPFNMIAMKNAVQGRQYFNRMYSTPKGTICYMFNFSSIASNPSSKGYSTADLDKVNTNNKILVDNADTAFKALIQSFTYVTTPDGDNEALHSTTPAK